MSLYTILTFDVEEFDMPLEYNQQISLEEQMKIGNQGLSALVSVLDKYNIPCTLFTTANFANTFPESIRQLSEKHEIASHTYYHSSFENKHLRESKLALEAVTGKRVTGLRMPRMRKVEMQAVKDAGYLYDSSINPTYLPGRYNNFHLPRTVYKQENIIRVPATVSPFFRLPLFWLGFKNYPFWLFKKLCFQSLKKDGYLSLYFHPWEFTDISNYNMPGYTKKPNGEKLLKKLEKLIETLAPHTTFITMHNYLALKKNINP
jgi:peptidoglycan/xylan/chitin deacetylase (PgdA/CDA1 family)